MLRGVERLRAGLGAQHRAAWCVRSVVTGLPGCPAADRADFSLIGVRGSRYMGDAWAGHRVITVSRPCIRRYTCRLSLWRKTSSSGSVKAAQTLLSLIPGPFAPENRLGTNRQLLKGESRVDFECRYRYVLRMRPPRLGKQAACPSLVSVVMAARTRSDGDGGGGGGGGDPGPAESQLWSLTSSGLVNEIAENLRSPATPPHPRPRTHPLRPAARCSPRFRPIINSQP